MRPGGRAADQLRPVRFTRRYTTHAEGSVLCEFGGTRVLVHRERRDGVPAVPARQRQGLGHGRVRHAPARDAHAQRARGRARQAGRPHAGDPAPDRPLACAPCVDLAALGERTITIDCDVLQADGGTRTAAITGGYVALAMAAIDTLVATSSSRGTPCMARSPRSRSAS